MAQFELTLPKMGESVAEATIIKWLKNEGDNIEMDEAVLEIATDKVDSEVPSPAAGKLIKRLFNENDVVQVGAVIAIIETEANASSTVVNTQPTTKQEDPILSSKAEVSVPFVPEEISKTDANGKFYSPLVRNIAKAEGISMTELAQIQGSGLEGRVNKHDLLQYIENRGKVAPVQTSDTSAVNENKANNQGPKIAVSNSLTTSIKSSDVLIGEGDEIIEMDRMRKLIADHMVMSKHVSPHVTSYVEVDVTNIVHWRDRHKKEFEKRENEKLTFTPIFIEAIAQALKLMPMVNISVSGQNIIKRKHINIGMATALPSGNLIVPVIKDADQLNLLGIAKKVNDLANRARINKLKPDEIQDGTYTITNVGTFGNVMGTPVINQPQCAILAIGAIRKKPAVIETPHGDAIAIRHMMFLSHSYDHRVIDGALGGTFVRKVADILEAFDVHRKI
jgi:2-oxoglutarate dehydrogenase E2 component (dihydrolipoamide succinyltransferase)